MNDLTKLRDGCWCSDKRKPCPYHEGYLDAVDIEGLDLTSPETVEKATLKVMRLWPSIPPTDCRQIVMAVLRAVTEDSE